VYDVGKNRKFQMKIVFSSFCDVRAGQKEVRHGLWEEGTIGSSPLSNQAKLTYNKFTDNYLAIIC